jgi:hypothetical protein
MTEQEAKQRWCPFARTVEYTGGGGSQPRNRVADSRDMSVLASTLLGVQCIGSQCMAWRKTKAPAELNTAMVEWRDGYCGLGGKP